MANYIEIKNSTTCTHCGEDTSRAYRLSVYGGYMDVCEECFGHMCECPDCGSFFDETEGEWVGGEFMCANCAGYETPALDPYGHTKGFDFHALTGEDAQGLHLGVELELDGGHSRHFVNALRGMVGDWISCKHDGSLGKLGVELVTQPSTLKYQLEQWEDVLRLAREYNMDSEGNSGLHVHFSRVFGADSFENLSAETLAFEYALREFRNDFVKFSDRSIAHLDWCEIDARESAEDVLEYLNWNGDRYKALNTQNCDTLEIRLFNSTLDFTQFAAALELTAGMARWADSFGANYRRSIDACDDLERLFNGMTFSDFMAQVVQALEDADQPTAELREYLRGLGY